MLQAVAAVLLNPAQVSMPEQTPYQITVPEAVAEPAVQDLVELLVLQEPLEQTAWSLFAIH
jgi:hypothetical protein